MGDGFSIAWRVFDAQHWGVPQRRKRTYVVADFRGERAGKILFERESLRGNIAPSGEAREETADHAGGSVAGGGCVGCINPEAPIYAAHDKATRHNGGGDTRNNDGSGNGLGITENGPMYTLTGADRHVISFSPFACANQRNVSWLDCVPTLRANRQMTLPGVCFPVTLYEPKSALDENWSEHDVKNALRAEASKSSHVLCIDCRNHTANEVSATLQAKENGGQSLNFINPVCVAVDGYNQNVMEKPGAIRAGASDGDHVGIVCYDTTQITSPMNYSNPKPDDPCHPLCANAHVPLCVYDNRGNGGGKIAPTLPNAYYVVGGCVDALMGGMAA